jgi:hypothetical protein
MSMPDDNRVLDYRTPEKYNPNVEDDVRRMRIAADQQWWSSCFKGVGVCTFLAGLICSGFNDTQMNIFGGALLVVGTILLISGVFLKGQVEMIRWLGKK